MRVTKLMGTDSQMLLVAPCFDCGTTKQQLFWVSATSEGTIRNSAELKPDLLTPLLVFNKKPTALPFCIYSLLQGHGFTSAHHSDKVPDPHIQHGKQGVKKQFGERLFTQLVCT